MRAKYLLAISMMLAFYNLGNASAYCLKKPGTGSSKPYESWTKMPVKYRLSDTLKDQSAIVEAIDKAFQTWGSVSCSTLTFEKDSQFFSIDSTKVDDHPIPYIYIFWYTSSWQQLQDSVAYTFLFENLTGGIEGASIAINAFQSQFQWYAGSDSPPSSKLDVQGILTMQIGKIIGLWDSNVSGSVLDNNGLKFGDSSKRTLTQDDINGLTFLYKASDCPDPPAPGTDNCSSGTPTQPEAGIINVDGGVTIISDGYSGVSSDAMKVILDSSSTIPITRDSRAYGALKDTEASGCSCQLTSAGKTASPLAILFLLILGLAGKIRNKKSTEL